MIRIILLLLLLALGGGYYWYQAPDLPPRPWEPLGSWAAGAVYTRLGVELPFLPAVEKPMPKLDAQLQKQVDAEVLSQIRATMRPKPGSVEEKEAQIRSQLQATGLPVSGGYIMETEKGDQVLAVGLSYTKLTSGSLVSTRAGLKEGINALIKLVDTKTLSLAGLHDVTVAVQDDEGRILFGVSAPVATIEAYRGGKATQRELIRSMGFQGQSRAAIVDGLRQGIQGVVR